MLRNRTLILSILALLIFLIAIMIAFWPGYFGRLWAPIDFRFHAHGISMTLWCLLLIIQPILYLKKKLFYHRILGICSYILVPSLMLSAILLVHFRLNGPYPLSTMGYYFCALTLNSMLMFGVFYGVAILYKKNPSIHGRWILSTVFPIITPATDRLIYGYFPGIIPMAPTIDGNPIVPFFGFLLADSILIILTITGWSSNGNKWIFPAVLLMVLAYQFSVFHFYQYSLWQRFCDWFLNLPLS